MMPPYGAQGELRRIYQPVEKRLAGLQRHLPRCLWTRWNLRWLASDRRRAAACASLLGPLAPKARSRLTFCPEAIIRASEFTFSSHLSLNLLEWCHSLTSANSGSTHTARFLRALR